MSVNVGAPRPDPHKPSAMTGHYKQSVDAIQVSDPGPKHGGRGSGVAGDFLGDLLHHGGSDQAVYAYAREDVDYFEGVIGHPLPSGWMGENLTTHGIDVNAAVVGERWQVGEVVLEVRCPRIPCATFRGVANRPGWLKEFTAAGRIGPYLAVREPGTIRPGDSITVRSIPEHGVTIQELFWALTIKPELAPRVLDAAVDLAPSDLAKIQQRANARA